MEIGTTIAVIAGLSIGVGLILTFALIFNQPIKQINNPVANPTVLEPTYHVNLEIVGMKDSYHIGEPITFTLTVKGYGYYCQSPNAAIWNASAAFASIPGWRSGLPEVLCNAPQPNHEVDDKYSWDLNRNVTINVPGKYILGARIAGDPPVQKEFTVTR